MEAKLITLSGRVQGVGFRYHTKSIADQYGIKGYAKNLAQDVEVLAIGEREELELFTEQVVNSPAPGSKVEDHTVRSVESYDNYENFKTL